MTTTSVSSPRSNKYAGKCTLCAQWVPAGAGLLVKDAAGKWAARHNPCPAPAAPAKRADVGYYVKSDGTMLVVVKSRNSERTYAKRLVVRDSGSRKTVSWEYAPGEAATVAEVTPLTLDDAAEFGHAHGFCFKCCRPLTDPESVKRGIGPVCAKALTR